jgi:hypothetical protein
MTVVTRGLAGIMAATSALVAGPSASPKDINNNPVVSKAAEQTVQALAEAINNRDSASVCKFVLALRGDGCEAQVGRLLARADRHVTVQSTTASVVGDFIKVQARTTLSDGAREDPESTLWLQATHPETLIRPGRFLLRALGQEADSADTDARPLLPADLQRPAGPTANAKPCRPTAVAGVLDKASDVAAPSGVRATRTRRARFDIRSVRVGFAPAGSTCITIRFAKPVRAGLFLQLSLDQDRLAFDTARTLLTTSIIFEPRTFSTVATQPAGMTANVHANSVTVLLRPGAINRAMRWSLQVEASTVDDLEPLIRRPVSAYDTALVQSAHR